jgi:hypothetical protein
MGGGQDVVVGGGVTDDHGDAAGACGAVQHQGAVGLGDQRPQAVVPVGEVLQDRGLGRLGVGEVDAGEPGLGDLERGVDVQTAVALPVGEEALAGAEREEHAAADGRARGVTAVNPNIPFPAQPGGEGWVYLGWAPDGALVTLFFGSRRDV